MVRLYRFILLILFCINYPLLAMSSFSRLSSRMAAAMKGVRAPLIARTPAQKPSIRPFHPYSQHKINTHQPLKPKITPTKPSFFTNWGARIRSFKPNWTSTLNSFKKSWNSWFKKSARSVAPVFVAGAAVAGAVQIDALPVSFTWQNVDEYPQYKEQFIKHVCETIKSNHVGFGTTDSEFVGKDKEFFQALCRLLQTYPDAAEKIYPHIFADLRKQYGPIGYDSPNIVNEVFRRLDTNDPAISSAIEKSIAYFFSTTRIYYSESGKNIAHILRRFETVGVSLLPVFFEHEKTIEDHRLNNFYMNLFAKTKFHPAIIEHIAIFLDNHPNSIGTWINTGLHFGQRSFADLFYPVALKHLKKLNDHVIENLLLYSSRALNDFNKLDASKIIEMLPPSAFNICFDKFSPQKQQELIQLLKPNYDPNKSIVSQLLDPNAPAYLIKCTEKNHKNTQTEKHACSNLETIRSTLSKLGDNLPAKAMLVDAFKKEEEETARGNYVFYHGQRWPWQFKADMYKQFRNLVESEQIGDDFQILRFGNNREKDWWYVKDALFMNGAIFGNSAHPGSCTYWYIMQNHDFSGAKDKKFSTEWMAEHWKLQQYYNHHQKEFNELETLHGQASSYGNLLLISMTKDQASKFAHSAFGNADKRKIKIGGTLFGTWTDDAQKILDTLKASPEKVHHNDHIEYVMEMTDEVLNHKTGPKIYSFNAADPAKWKEYTQKRDALFAKIRQEIATDKASKAMATSMQPAAIAA